MKFILKNSKCRATSSSLAGLDKLIKDHMYWSVVEFTQVNEKQWSVSHAKGLSSFFVQQKGKEHFQLREVTK